MNVKYLYAEAPKRAGKFSGAVELFYLEIVRQPLKTKALALAESLHSQNQWGRRAEDPFRGLRAGPVRYSPLSLSPSGDPEFPARDSPKHPKTPQDTPDTSEHGESVPKIKK